LQELLARDPRLAAEYEQFHKLTNDPRVTPAGRFIRKYSLDELPQLWNVLVGDMSLVGPRPYLEREIPDMDQKENIILRVKPGITGIWQVTFRNSSTFEQRVQLDVEYVRSWSPWLDLYVLARTVPVVLGGTGT
ncbi:MAG TPA: sugar transferase, partial [Polyangiaceae bacterium]